MKREYALLISLLIALIFAGDYLLFYDFSSDRELVNVERAIDGDTLELEDGREIRLLNINTPEKNEFGYGKAHGFLKNFENKSLELEVDGVDKYGRNLGKIYDSNYVNLEIVELGLGNKFLVKESELELFKKAEEKAFNNALGIWERSPYYGCLDVTLNKEKEYLDIDIDCDISTDGWIIKDESTKKYILGDIKGNKIRLYSDNGENNEKEIYWGEGNVWNDDRDSIFIRDEEGKIIYYFSYGY